MNAITDHALPNYTKFIVVNVVANGKFVNLQHPQTNKYYSVQPNGSLEFRDGTGPFESFTVQGDKLVCSYNWEGNYYTHVFAAVNYVD